MAEARLDDSRAKASRSQGDSSSNSSSSSGWQFPKAPTQGTTELLSIAEIERRYGIDAYRIYLWANEGLLNVVPIGKRFKYLDHEVRAAIAKCSYHLVAA